MKNHSSKNPSSFPWEEKKNGTTLLTEMPWRQPHQWWRDQDKLLHKQSEKPSRARLPKRGKVKNVFIMCETFHLQLAMILRYRWKFHYTYIYIPIAIVFNVKTRWIKNVMQKTHTQINIVQKSFNRDNLKLLVKRI
jgi:hypothetical protein